MTPKSFLILAVALFVGLSAAPSRADESIVDAVATDDGFVFRVVTPKPKLELEPDGSAAVTIEGFETQQRLAGAPDIPHRTLLVAIPPDAEPRLEFRVLGKPSQYAVQPRAVGKRLADLDEADQEALNDPELDEERRIAIFQRSARFSRTPDRSIYEGRRTYPENLAWLGATGVIRDQRYVEVHLAPVRYDGRKRGIESVPELEVTVHFNSASRSRGSSPADDPSFEALYRKTFLNHAQGRSFRVSGAVDFAPDRGGDAEPAPLLVGTPIYRIRIRQNGPVRLPHSLLLTPGFPSYALSTWRLTNRGVTVPLQIQDTDADGFLDSNEWVQFYGQALDDEPKTAFNYDLPGNDDIWEARDFTDENVYFLQIAGAQPQMTQRDATPNLSLTPPTNFEAVDRREVDSTDGYRPLGGADPWYWLPSIFSNNGSANQRDEIMPLVGLASGTLPAHVAVHMRGVSGTESLNPDHQVLVTLKNGSAQTLASAQSSFDDRTLHLAELDWTYPGSGAQLSTNAEVELKVLVNPGSPAPANDVILDWIEVRYRRSFQAVGDMLTFDWPDGASQEFVVSNLTSNAITVYETTKRLGASGVVDAVRLTGTLITGGPSYSVRFRVNNDASLADGTQRRFVVAATAATPAPADFTTDTVSNLRDQANQASLIVIAHPSVVDPCYVNQTACPPADPLTALLAYRATPAGGGLTSKVVLMQDVEDEFNNGLPGPLAIREFLRFVLSNANGEGWAAPKPSHVLLLGDASFDYKAGTSFSNYVPTQIMFHNVIELGYYASDDILAAVVGNDPIADLVVGRMAASSKAQADVMLSKTLANATPAAGSWRKNVLFVSDRGHTPNNPGEAFQFEGLNDQAQDFMQRPPYTSRHLKYWNDYYGEFVVNCCGSPNNSSCNPSSCCVGPTCPWNIMRDDIIEAVNGADGFSNGAAIVQYLGHGSFHVWSDDAFQDDRTPPPFDSDQLTNANALPYLLAHNCLTGAFHLTTSSGLGENWVKRSGGGAVAAFSPSGLSFNFISTTVIDGIWDDMFGPRKERLIAPPVMDTWVTLCSQGSIESCQYYVLQGDPAARLALQSVEPAKLVTAAGGNAQVSLSWSASATPGATYDVYRACVEGTHVCNGAYSKRNVTPINGTNYLDTSVYNTEVYYYYVVARDAAGFESRWSNFNSDCVEGQPDQGTQDDCVQATPLNPNSPSAPTGLAVSDPGTNQLVLTWNLNPEVDIDYYTVHYGTSSGVYTFVAWGGRNSTATLSGLTEGEVYYIAITATNTSGHESPLSAEVSDYPVLAPGLRPPRFIDDLKVRPSGSNLVLEWSEVTTDVFGKPLSVDRYDVYRGPAPGFTIAGTALVGSCNAPCSAFTDVGAKTNPASFKYLVRAVDEDGNGGGLGSDLPSQNMSLVVNPSPTPGFLVLSWNPTTTSLDGLPLQLLHYAVYSASQPFSREAVRDGQVPLLTTTAATSHQILIPAGEGYYSVLAVDIRGNVSPY